MQHSKGLLSTSPCSHHALLSTSADTTRLALLLAPLRSQGHAWNVGYCAAGLIGNGTLPPFVVAAVDSAGPMRSLNYLPYKPGECWQQQRPRPDAMDSPGTQLVEVLLLSSSRGGPAHLSGKQH